jgi:type IV secretory pathway TrbF-like protein
MTTAVLTTEQESISSGREKENPAIAQERQDAGNPFLDVRRAWNGVWKESLSNRRRWRLMALVEAGLLALALFGLIHLGSQPKAIPYIVEVKQTGRGSLRRAAGSGSSRQQCH